MPVSPVCRLRRPLRSGVIGAVLCLLASALPAHARGPEPALRIDLHALGYQDFPSQMLDSGAAVLTTHFIDANHVLVTFSKRRLLMRIPDDPPDDLDRNLDALLIELPSGKLLAQTSWRAHDIGQYLWSLGDGNFLLRLQDRLVTISPLRNLARGDAFAQHPLVTSRRPIGAIFVSFDGELLTLETLDRKPASDEARSPSPRTQAYAAAMAEAARPRSPTPVQVNFFRIGPHPETGFPLAQNAGEVRSPALILVPVDSAGYVATVDQGQHHYAFDFHQHTGKVDELSPFESTCQPAPILVTHGEFIALGCRGGNQLQMLGGFNLRGEEMWEQVLPEPYVNPSFSFAPAAGRFALGRVITTSAIEGGKSDALSRNLGVYPSSSGGPVASQIQSQTVNVFQMETGRLLFTMTCSPVVRAGGNFALSAEGTELAVARGGALEIYKLPPLSGKEQALLAKAGKYAPAANDAPVHLNGRAVALPTPAQEEQTAGVTPATPAHTAAGTPGLDSGAAAAKDKGAPPAMTSAASKEPNGAENTVAVQSVTPAKSAASPSPKAAEGPTNSGDPGEGGRRKPPSLYEPGEKQDAKTPDAKTPNPQ